MLIYEKKVEENDELVRHLFYTDGNIPANDDDQLSYKDGEGSAISDLTVTSKLLDDGHGGIMNEDGDAITVWAGDVNIIPGNIDAEEETGEDDGDDEPEEPVETPTNDNSGDDVTEPEEEPTE